MSDKISDQIINAGITRWVALVREVADKTSAAKELLLETQSACEHPDEHIVESGSNASQSLFSRFRVCRRCGYAEHALWYNDYYLLEREHITYLDIESARSLIYGRALSEDDVRRLREAREMRRVKKLRFDKAEIEDAEKAGRGE